MLGHLAETLLWLFVLNLGTAFGAGLYEHRVVLSHWLTSSRESGAHWNADAARRDDTGRMFWAFVTTVPLSLLTFASLFAAWHARSALGDWWLAVALVALVDRGLTFAYFIPTMVRLMKAPDSPESVAVAMRWRNLNHVRHAIVLAAWLLSLQALASLYRG